MNTQVFKRLSCLAVSILFLNACGDAQDTSSETKARICRFGDCIDPVGPIVAKRAPNLKVRIVSSNCSTQKVVFEVYNTGLLAAPATVARATFDGGSPKNFSIPALAVGAKFQVSTSLYFPGGDLVAVFQADANNTVVEQSESDNKADLFCIG